MKPMARKPSPMPADTLLSEAADVLAPDAAASDVRGLIDNATADRLYGWAWDAGHPGYRVKVELRLAGEVVATTMADFARPDLARLGIGDGCHAFEFPLLRQWFRQLRDLSAVAFGRDGSEFLIPVHARGQDEMLVPAQATAQLQSAAEALLVEHQSVRREIEVLRQRSAELPEATAVEAIAKAGQDLQRRLDSLELWITRLDSRLAEIARPAAPRDRGRVDIWQAVLIALLLAAISAAATVVVVRHGF